MKFLSIFAFVLLLSPAVHAAHADSASATQQVQHVLPVLVQVDRHGKVVEVSPSVKMRPSVQRVLRTTLEKMIVKPAMRKGRPVSSQFVVNMAMKAVPRDDGKFDVRFTYVSSVPLPQGDWFWQKVDHRRVALARRVPDSLRPSRQRSLIGGQAPRNQPPQGAARHPLSASPPRLVRLAQSRR